MAGPFNGGDTIINKHFTFLLVIPVGYSLGSMDQSKTTTPLEH